MKVLFIHHCAVPGGASRSLYNLMMHLPIAPDNMHVVTPTGSVATLFREITPNVYQMPVRALPSFLPSAAGIRFLFPRSLFGYLKNKGALREIRVIIHHIKPDIVHINDTAIVPIAIQAARMGVPVIMHARTARALHPGYFDRMVDKWIRKHGIKLVCINESVRKGFAPDLDACVVHNPLYGENTLDYQADQLKRQNPDDPLKCLFLSNFLEYKGIFETIDAARILRDVPNVHFLVAGAAIRPRAFYDSPIGRILDRLNLYPDIERRIEHTIRKHKLTNVTLLGHVRNIDALIRTCHLNLAPVWLDAPMRSVFEAGAQYVPSILALTNDMGDVVEHGKSGLIIPPRNAQALADAILKLRDDEALRQAMGQRARQLAMENNDPVHSAHQIMRLYERSIDGQVRVNLEKSYR